jgi:diamine N-acetyltransferase
MLDGSLVTLRAPCDGDRVILGALRNDLGLQAQLMALPRANSAHRVDEWLGRMLSDPGCVFFVIADKLNQALGFIQVTRMDFVHGTGEFGICLAEHGRGGGRAQEAVALLTGYVREVFNLRKLTLQVLVSNQRATRFHLKSGFVPVGVLKQHFYHARAYHDVGIYEMLLT